MFGHAPQAPLPGEVGFQGFDQRGDPVAGAADVAFGGFAGVAADQRQDFQRIAEDHQPRAGKFLRLLLYNLIQQRGDPEKQLRVEAPHIGPVSLRQRAAREPQIGFDVGRSGKFREQPREEVPREQHVVDAELPGVGIVVRFPRRDQVDVAALNMAFDSVVDVGGGAAAHHDQLVEAVVGVAVADAVFPVVHVVADFKAEVLPRQFVFQICHAEI